MKVMILAGGFGSRISEESIIRPKPMVEIGSMPILWHIMKIYSSHGLNEFVICCGYKGHMIKDWFEAYSRRNSDVTFDFRTNQTEIHNNCSEPWRVTLADTGAETMTGGRIKKALQYVDEKSFCLTYGDGVGDVDISATIDLHASHDKLVTMTAVKPEGRFGVFNFSPDDHAKVSNFQEKPKDNGAWINAGFFVLDREIGEYIDSDSTSWEAEPMQTLAKEGQIMAHRHTGFWMPMDTLRDKKVLEDYWESGNPPWKSW